MRSPVEQLMREFDITGAVRGRKVITTITDPFAPRAPDLVDRDFVAPAPNRCWAADFTHVATFCGCARAKCNNGWCAIVYTPYLEKDQALSGSSVGGHRHDWESVMVWVRQGAGKPSYLSASRHGGFSTHPVNRVPVDGAHVKIVYHKDGASTHAFRFAKWGERAEAWGYGGWDRPALVSWDHFPRSNNGVNLQRRLNGSSRGKANLPIQDSKFNDTLNKAKPNIPFNPWG